VKNEGTRGSLLKVWEGLIEYQEHEKFQFECTIYSESDIKMFQKLPDIPENIIMSG
jgi:hypothetical protein